MSIVNVFIALLAGIILVSAGALWRRWLAAVWIFSVLVLPLIRFQVGAPLYVMDLVSALLLCQMIGRGGRFLPFRVFPWPWLFIGLALVSTVASGLLLFGYHLEQIWIWGHYSVSCLPMIFATIVRNDPDTYYTKPLIVGLTVSLFALAVIGIIQYFDLPGNQQIRDFFYGHFQSDSGDVGQMVERMWKTTQVTRVPGPLFSPGGFGGTTLLGFLALVVLQRGKYTFSTYLSVFSTGIVALTSVTRLVLVASAAGLIVFILLCSHKERLKAIIILGTAVLIGATFLGQHFSEAWSERLRRWDKGVMEDDNVLARAIEGPLRLFHFFSAQPEALIFGAGPDPEKLLSRTQQDSNFESGFVSNSFLLALYYMGGVGFICYTRFWLKVLQSSFKASGSLRSAFSATAVVCGIIIAADNYAMMFEAAATVLNLVAGLILNEIIVTGRQRPMMGEPDDCEQLSEADAA